MNTDKFIEFHQAMKQRSSRRKRELKRLNQRDRTRHELLIEIAHELHEEREHNKRLHVRCTELQAEVDAYKDASLATLRALAAE